MLETLIDKVKEEGIEEGELSKAINIAKELKKINITSEEISRITGLPIEKLQ